MIFVGMVGSRVDDVKMLNQGAIRNSPRTGTENEFASIVSIGLTGRPCLPKTYSGSDDTVVETVADGVPPPPLDDAPNRCLGKLTNRQRDGLTLLAQDKSNIEITALLGLTDKTVGIHVSVITKTLNVQNQIQDTLIAARAVGQIWASYHSGA